MPRPVLHADQEFLSQDIGHSLGSAGATVILTDALIVSADTNAGLIANARLFAGHSDTKAMVEPIVRAIQYGKDDASLSDANILNETTIAGLVADTYSGVGEVGPLLI